VSRPKLRVSDDPKVQKNREKARKWAAAHSEWVRYKVRIWQRNNAPHRKAYLQEWRDKNPEKLRALRVRELEKRRERRRENRPLCRAANCKNVIPLGNKKFCESCSKFYRSA